jgi:hypothetical protein
VNKPNDSCCARAPGRGRVALLCGVACFVAGQLALGFVLNHAPPVRDPEYGRRLTSLRARFAERPPGRPLVLFLGSSRVAMGIRPALFPANQSGGGPVVFNFGLCTSGPVMEWLCLRRLLADGIRPDAVFVETWWALTHSSPADQMAVVRPERLSGEDLGYLKPYYKDPRPKFRRTANSLVPWHAYRTHLLNQYAPAWVSLPQRTGDEWAGLDGWGWLWHAAMVRSYVGEPPWLATRNDYLATSRQFRANEDSRRALADVLSLCRQEKIRVALLAMPDGFLSDYEPAARARMDEFLREISRGQGVPLVDARDWAPLEDFVEGVHLTHDGAAAFTERFGREVLEPYLDGVPPGRFTAGPR